LLIPDDPYLNGPIGVRHTTKTEKEKAGLDGSLVPGLPVSERDRLQHALTMQRLNFRVGQDFDIRRVLDAIDEILRHAVVQPLAAHHDDDLSSVARKVDRRLRR
jgi:hypothetical protein